MTTATAPRPQTPAKTGRSAPRGPRGPHHTWTDQERDYVRANYEGTHDSRDVIARTLNVSPFAVSGQIAKMGLSKRTDRKPWTKEADDTLRELVPTLSVHQIANRMNRSENSVTVRLKRLRLHRRDRAGWFTMREVTEILCKDHKWIRKRIESGALKATRHTLPESRNPAIEDRHTWHIAEADLRDFILRYPQDLDARNVDLITIVHLLAGMPQEKHEKGDPPAYLMTTLTMINRALALTKSGQLPWRPTRRPREAKTVIGKYTITVTDPANMERTLTVHEGKREIEALNIADAGNQAPKMAELCAIALRQAMNTDKHMRRLTKELAQADTSS